MAYLLDTNVFIEARNRHYGFDFCPAFWEWLILKNAEGILYSIEQVSDEIKADDTDLHAWKTALPKGFFLATNANHTEAFGKVSTWAQGQKYTDAAKDDFLSKADYFLVGHALQGNHVVVTHERPSNSVKMIKIPDACVGLDVKYVSTYEMLRNEKAKFVLPHRVV